MFEKFEINNSCINCDLCRPLCPENAIFTDGEKYIIDSWSCTRCGICMQVCPNDSVKIRHPQPESDLLSK
ncbi:MAG: ferredoxin [Halobacteriovoraceae bacterium]|nr:ferredoxin [Halobacteriovoraceae bacterium]